MPSPRRAKWTYCQYAHSLPTWWRMLIGNRGACAFLVAPVAHAESPPEAHAHCLRPGLDRSCPHRAVGIFRVGPSPRDYGGMVKIDGVLSAFDGVARAKHLAAAGVSDFQLKAA